ncbi:MAG TPA: HAD-IA family hydrolase [Gemmatimonadaceae bacterium]|nr:HAD-IA family hydrolase [Gemmatimonadaceae bacterium]
MTESAAARSATRPIAVLFDLDGTLIDSIDLLLGAFRHAFGTVVGRIPPEEAWVAGIGTPLVTQMREFARDEAELETLIAVYRAYQREHHDRLIREFEGARDTLALIHGRGHPTALVTSKIVELAVRALDYTRLHEFIDVVIGADLCERHKPDPEPVHFALRELGYEPERAVFVGDSPHDIGAGNAAGVITVAAHWGPFDAETLERAGPTYSIEHIAQLPALIERLQERAAERR